MEFGLTLPSYWEWNNHPNWRTPSFFGGRETTKQFVICCTWIIVDHNGGEQLRTGNGFIRLKVVKASGTTDGFVILGSKHPILWYPKSRDLKPHQDVASIIELDNGKIYRKALYLMVKSIVSWVVSCRFSLKPIQWIQKPSLGLHAQSIVRCGSWWSKHRNRKSFTEIPSSHSKTLRH